MRLPVKKVMCIYPPTGMFNREDRCQDRAGDIVTVVSRPPMPLLYEAAIVKKAGKEIIIKDYSAHEGAWYLLKEDIASYRPDMLVFNVTTPSFKEDIKTAACVKEVDRNIIVVGRGAYFNMFHREVLEKYSDVDVLIRGEWEETFDELVRVGDLSIVKGISYRLQGELFVNPERPVISNLDIIPFPDRSVFDNRLSFRPDTRQPEATIIAARGCPYQCIYCLASVVNGGCVRMRSPKNIVDELQECVQRFGIKTFLFRSDLFTFKQKWVYEICDEIIARNLKIGWACNTRVDTIDAQKARRMKQAGCWAVAMGVESGNEESLRKMKKGITLKQAEEAVRVCRKSGLKVFSYFLIGFPWETHRHIQDTINFAIKLDADLAQFSPIYPYPGTPLYDLAASLGLITPEKLHPYALVKAAMGTQFLSMDEVERYLGLAWKRFHLRPGYILRTLHHAGPANVLNYLRFGCRALFKLQKLQKVRA